VSESNVKRLMGTGLALSIALFAMVASASAKEPTGNFAVFKQCPTNNPAVNLCFATHTEGGEFQVGKIVVPIVKAQTLQFGSILNEETGAETAVEAENGETLVKTPQVVSGGIFALVKEGRYPWYLRNFCKNFPNNSECKVTATAESVGGLTISRTNLLFEEGTALGLPLRIHLKNPFLGGRCFIGSATSPLQFNYTTGATSPPPPNVPINGAVGELEFTNEFTNIIVKNDLVVDNAFSAPGAEGCGGPQSLIVDAEIDQKNALPSPAGDNTTKLFGMLFNATAEAVKNNEA
jgi:hypothetical protein